MMMLAAAAAVKCPYCQIYHEEVSKKWGASNEELNELAELPLVFFLFPDRDEYGPNVQ